MKQLLCYGTSYPYVGILLTNIIAFTANIMKYNQLIKKHQNTYYLQVYIIHKNAFILFCYILLGDIYFLSHLLQVYLLFAVYFLY